MKIFVIRHGETDVNVRRLINSHNNIGLNENGVNQAKNASKVIENLNIDLIFCSPLVRAKETCDYVNINNIDVVYDERLVERDSKSMGFQPDSIIDLEVWYDKNKEVIYDDAEGFKSILNRVSSFFTEIKDAYYDKDLLIVTHGDVFKAIFLYFNPNSTLEEVIKYDKENCEIVEFNI